MIVERDKLESKEKYWENGCESEDQLFNLLQM